MKFSVDIRHNAWPLSFIPEFIRITATGLVYRIIEHHESKRTPKRLICEVERLGKIPVDDESVIDCFRYKRQRK